MYMEEIHTPKPQNLPTNRFPEEKTLLDPILYLFLHNVLNCFCFHDCDSQAKEITEPLEAVDLVKQPSQLLLAYFRYLGLKSFLITPIYQLVSQLIGNRST